METGNWVSKDMYNGRIARIPNSAVLKGPVFNYSQGFQFIWDEIKVVFTTTSDCQFAKEMLTRVAKEVIGDYLAEAQTSWKAVSDYYETANPSLEPAITLTVNGGKPGIPRQLHRGLHQTNHCARSTVHENCAGSRQ